MRNYNFCIYSQKIQLMSIILDLGFMQSTKHFCIKCLSASLLKLFRQNRVSCVYQMLYEYIHLFCQVTTVMYKIFSLQSMTNGNLAGPCSLVTILSPYSAGSAFLSTHWPTSSIRNCSFCCLFLFLLWLSPLYRIVLDAPKYRYLYKYRYIYVLETNF